MAAPKCHKRACRQLENSYASAQAAPLRYQQRTLPQAKAANAHRSDAPWPAPGSARPDTGCDADSIPHGFRKVMGDMAAEMGDEELMSVAEGSIHDRQRHVENLLGHPPEVLGAAKKAGHMGLAASGFREGRERRWRVGWPAPRQLHGLLGRHARGAKLMLSARAGGPPQWDPRPQHIRQEYRETRELRKEGFETRQERAAGPVPVGPPRRVIEGTSSSASWSTSRTATGIRPAREHGPGIRDRGNDARL